MIQPVFDIVNCGPRHQFWANGKLVHNSDKINLQNLSKRTKDPVLRRSMKAPPNHLWVAADSSQIEARLNAYMSCQTDLVQLFIDGRDPYIDMATAIFGLSYDEIYEVSKANPTKEGKMMRNLGKEAVLACGYGMSWATFKYRMELTGNFEAAAMAERIVAAYRNKNSMIVAFWRVAQKALDAMYAGTELAFGGPNNDLFLASGNTVFHGERIPSIELPNGTYIFYQNLRSELGDDGRINYVYDQFKGRGFEPKRIWGSALVENVCQALAFAILKWQAINIHNEGYVINSNVHDEWAGIYPKEQVRGAIDSFAKNMREVPDYLPQGLLNCEVDIGLNYADLHTVPI